LDTIYDRIHHFMGNYLQMRTNYMGANSGLLSSDSQADSM